MPSTEPRAQGRVDGAPPQLEIRHLSRRFGNVRGVENLSATFDPGRVTALIGPNGAGKTTLFHLIAGAIRPDSGEIRVGGRRIDGRPPWQIARLGVSRLFQDVRIFRDLTVRENLLTARPSRAGETPWSSLIRGAEIRRTERAASEAAQQVAERTDLTDVLEQRAGTLSFGRQKLLAIARMLMTEPRVLLLDEPTAGITPSLVPTVLKIMRELARQGRAVIVIEHNMGVVLDAADWVYFLDEGQIVAFGSAEDVLNDRDVRAAYLGL